ncbi:MAG TPA: hypothetical protein VGZ02_09400 [Candidatus Baltobacteraceae bacterium]|nr:hypothetical protein [Candidatus Baltobacteraceae bacterium]
MAFSIAQCLQSLGTGAERARWTSFEDRHRWVDAVRTGLPVVSEGVQCVTGVRWTPESATLMITPLQWAVLLGVDAYRSGDVATLRALGNQYLPLAERYQAGDRDDFEQQAYRHAILYLKDFRQGHCTFDLCTQKNYP